MDLESRFVGCLLGHLVGDATGAPFEGLTPELIIYSKVGGGRASEIVANPPLRELHYTDDTQMTIAVAEVLVRDGRIDDDRLMAAFVENYDPNRGYGTGARRILDAARLGEDWRAVAASHFPGGSYGNGAAMRVAPVGLFFHRDLDLVWEQAGRSARLTHGHVLGIEGAQLLATAVALAVRGEAGEHDHFFAELLKRATQEEYQWLLRYASQLTAKDSLGYLGSSLEAHRSVVTAIACFAVNAGSYSDGIARGLALGDDTDTVMAMTGAIAGAHLGVEGVPGHLLAKVENGEKGRDYVAGLGRGLYGRFASGGAGFRS